MLECSYVGRQGYKSVSPALCLPLSTPATPLTRNFCLSLCLYAFLHDMIARLVSLVYTWEWLRLEPSRLPVSFGELSRTSVGLTG